MCLQRHRYASPLSAATKLFGVNDVPACEPSQNGWFRLRPQTQKAYSWPAVSSTAMGLLSATMGLSNSISSG